MTSGIQGETTVVFGGKIGGRICIDKNGEKSVALGFDELNNFHEIGKGNNVNMDEHNDTKVYMVFNKVESIDTVIKWLNKTKVALQRIQSENKNI